MIDLDSRDFLQPPWIKNVNLLGETSHSTIIKNRSDVIFCLIEWLARVKPIVIVIDEIQWLTPRDWQMTRRLVGLVKKKNY